MPTSYNITATASNATTDRLTINTTDNMFPGLPIVFSGMVFGGITAGATYYIGEIIAGYPTSNITLTSLPGGATVGLTTATGSMTGTFVQGGQQIIPTATPGLPLNQAFGDINTNFDQIFAAGPVLSNISIANNTVYTNNTNGNLVLNPNGIGAVVANAHVIPDTTNVRNLGSTNLKWDTVYTNYFDIAGDLEVGANLTVNGNLIVEGDTIQIGNITTDTLLIQLANSATNAASANGAGITVGANDNIATLLYDSTANAWTTNIALETGNLILTDDRIMDLYGPSITNADLISGPTSGLDIVPNGDGNATVLYNTYGNILFQSSNTGANVKTFTFAYDGAVSLPGAVSAVGNITANYFFGNGSQLTGLSTSSISNGTSNVDIANVDGPVTINVNSTETWEFDDSGNLTLPSNGSIVVDGGDGIIGPVSDDMVISWDNEEIRLVSVQGSIEMQADNAFRVQTNYDGGTDTYLSRWEFRSDEIVNITGSSTIVTEAGNLTLSGGRDGVNSGNTTIRSVDVGVAVYDWTFGNNGLFTLPGGNVAIGLQYGSEAILATNTSFGVASQGNATTFLNWSDDVANTSALSAIYVNDPSGNTGDIAIRTGNIGNAYIWSFGFDGNLNLPSEGNIVGVTANNSGYLQWIGNSSGDGFGFTTMQLVPDNTLSSEQCIIVDPTGPNHVHLRAGGTQDNSPAQLYLGGENSHFKIDNGLNPNVYATANSYKWTFGSDGNLILPGDNAATAFSRITSLANSSGDGAGYTTLQLVPDVTIGTGTDQYLIIDPTAPGHIHIRAGGTQDSSGADLIFGGENSHVKVTGGPNPPVYVLANNQSWMFGVDGVFQAPGDISSAGNVLAGNVSVTGNVTGANVVSANTFVSNAFNVVTAGNLSITSQYGLGFTGTILEDNGTLELIGSGAGGVYAGWDSNYGNGLGNIATVSFNEVGGEGILLRTGNRAATEYNWNFDSTGNLTLPGNITGNTAGYTIGYRDIPQVTFSANATAALTDAGKHYYSTTAGNLSITLPNNSSVAFPTGATLTIVVNAAGNVLVNQGSGVTLYQAGASATGNRVVGAYGLASVMKVAANTWVISGTGVY